MRSPLGAYSDVSAAPSPLPEPHLRHADGPDEDGWRGLVPAPLAGRVTAREVVPSAFLLFRSRYPKRGRSETNPATMGLRFRRFRRHRPLLVWRERARSLHSL